MSDQTTDHLSGAVLAGKEALERPEPTTAWRSPCGIACKREDIARAVIVKAAPLLATYYEDKGATEREESLYAFFNDSDYPEAELRFKLGVETKRADSAEAELDEARKALWDARGQLQDQEAAEECTKCVNGEAEVFDEEGRSPIGLKRCPDCQPSVAAAEDKGRSEERERLRGMVEKLRSEKTDDIDSWNTLTDLLASLDSDQESEPGKTGHDRLTDACHAEEEL